MAFNIPKIILEIGKTHGGSLGEISKFFEEAKEAGVHAVKCQYYRIDKMREDHLNYERYKRNHLTVRDLEILKATADHIGIGFYPSVFCADSLKDMIGKFNTIKIPATFFEYEQLVEIACDNFREVKLSMPSYEDKKNEELLKKYRSEHNNLTVYLCTQRYPTKDFRLNNIIKYNLDGYSHHGDYPSPIITSAMFCVKEIEIHSTVKDVPDNDWEFKMFIIKEIIKDLGYALSDIESTPITCEEIKNEEFYKAEFNK